MNAVSFMGNVGGRCPGLFLDVMGTPGDQVGRVTLELAGWGPRPLEEAATLSAAVGGGAPRAVWTQRGSRGAKPLWGGGVCPEQLL